MKDKNEEKDIKGTPVWEVIDKYFKRDESWTPLVQDVFERWLVDEEDPSKAREIYRALLEKQKEYNLPANEETARALKIFRERAGFTEVELRVGDSKRSATASMEGRTTKRTLRNYFLRVAAVILPLVLVAGGYLYLSKQESHIPVVVAMTEVTTGPDETKEIVLPDGSTVWMNETSTIRYAVDKSSSHRSVELSGEAFFQVVKDPTRPFHVKTADVSVTVLGTEFNVKAYNRCEETMVTLKNGKVTVETTEQELFTLDPGEMLAYNKVTKKTEQTVTDPDVATAWKQREIYFDNETLEEILNILEKQYHTTFDVDKRLLTTERFTFVLKKDDSLAQSMQIMEKIIEGFSYSIANEKVTIRKK